MAGQKGWAAAAVLALVAAAGCAPRDNPGGQGSVATLEDSLAGLEGLAREFPAVGGEPLVFPRDHAVHRAHFTESWLVAGLLTDAAGRRHGFQLLLQRVALAAGPADRESSWAARSAWYGRFVLETPGERPLVVERLSRDALGLAGATEEPAAVWLEGWRIELEAGAGSMTLEAGGEAAGLGLELTLPGEPPAALAADARRGYWWPGLGARGYVRREGAEHAVTGSVLVERWWGQAPPAGRGQLALVRLWRIDASGNALRCEQLRRRGGGGTPLGGCSAYPSGRDLGDVLAPAADGPDLAAVPLRWRLDLPREAGAVLLRPMSEPAGATAEWSGMLLPEARDGSAADWGLLVLSNFTAP